MLARSVGEQGGVVRDHTRKHMPALGSAQGIRQEVPVSKVRIEKLDG